MNYQCKVESKSPIRRQLTISVPPEAIQEYIDQQFERLKKTAQIKGFRAGKVPLSILKQQYMADVKADVFSKVIRDSYVKALEENKLLAVGTPEIQTKSNGALAEGQALEFTATIEVFPEIKISDLTKLKATGKSSAVTEADIETSMKNLRENHADVVPDETAIGPVKTDDFVVISFQGSVGGEQLDVLTGDNRTMQVGSGNYMKEFEDNLIGMKKGETKSFDMDFPNEFNEPKLAGKTAKFEVTVHEFKKRELPELNDEFAKRFKLETALELRKKVVDTLTEDRSREAKEALRNSVIEALLKAHDFEVPSGLVASQLEYLVRENTDYLKRQGFTEKMIRDYLEKNQEQLSGRAGEQVKASLILDKIAEEQKIRADEKDLDLEYTKIAGRINLQLDQVRGLYEKDENAIRQLRFRIKEEKVMDYILGQVKVTEEKTKK